MVDKNISTPRPKPASRSKRAAGGAKAPSPKARPKSAPAAAGGSGFWRRFRAFFQPRRWGDLWRKAGRAVGRLWPAPLPAARRRRTNRSSRSWLRPGFRVGRPVRLAVLVLLALVMAVVAVKSLGYESGVSRAVTAFNRAVGLEPREDETFTGCLKGAAEGAFSSALPIAEIVAMGELMLASPPLVIMGAGLGCSFGIFKSVAMEGVGWAVHTGSEVMDVMLGR